MHRDLFSTEPQRRLIRTRDLPENIGRVVDLVAKEQKIARHLLLNVSRCRANAARARQLAMYLSHVVLGQSLTAVGEAFDRDRTTVSYACGLVEDLRDDPVLDSELDRLETVLLAGEAGHE